MKCWRETSAENSTEVVTKGSHGIGGDHGACLERFRSQPDLLYGRLPVRLYPSPTWFPIGKC